MSIATGGCLCGAIRYRIEAEPLFRIACHCRNCQYRSGGAASLTIVYPKVAFAVTDGVPRVFRATATSGGSQFCEVCGVHVFSYPDSRPDFVAVKVGSLDAVPADFRQQADLWMSSAPPWHEPHEGAVQFERNPPPSA